MWKTLGAYSVLKRSGGVRERMDGGKKNLFRRNMSLSMWKSRRSYSRGSIVGSIIGTTTVMGASPEERNYSKVPEWEGLLELVTVMRDEPRSDREDVL